MLERLLFGDLLTLTLVFCRIGSLVMLLPGIGDGYVPARMRLILALMITLIIAPLVSSAMPSVPKGALDLFLLMGIEILIGVFLGTLLRTMLSALSTAGYLISTTIGISNAFVFDPVVQQQGSLLSSLLSNLGVLLIFASDAHGMMFHALLDSYHLFAPGQVPPLGDLSEVMAHTVANSFKVALELSLPLLILAIVFHTGLGVLSRLMPQMPVFFVAQPAQIIGGLFILGITLPAAMTVFLRAFGDSFQPLIGH